MGTILIGQDRRETDPVFVLVESASNPANDSDTTPSPNDTTSTNPASGEVLSVSMSDDAAA